MKRGINRFTIVAGVISGLGFLAGADTPPSKAVPLTPTAYDALDDFDKAGHAADEAWKKAMMGAQNKLVDRLKKAKIAATKEGDLDAANAIDARLKIATAAAEIMTPDSHPMVTRATYVPIGQEAKAVDVTDLIASCAHGQSLEIGEVKMPDPTPGVHKCLIVEGSFGGTPYTMRLYDLGVAGFSLSRPAVKTK